MAGTPSLALPRGIDPAVIIDEFGLVRTRGQPFDRRVDLASPWAVTSLFVEQHNHRY